MAQGNKGEIWYYVGYWSTYGIIEMNKKINNAYCHATYEDAAAHIKKLRTKAIKSMRERLARMKALKF